MQLAQDHMLQWTKKKINPVLNQYILYSIMYNVCMIYVDAMLQNLTFILKKGHCT